MHYQIFLHPCILFFFSTCLPGMNLHLFLIISTKIAMYYLIFFFLTHSGLQEEEAENQQAASPYFGRSGSSGILNYKNLSFSYTFSTYLLLFLLSLHRPILLCVLRANKKQHIILKQQGFQFIKPNIDSSNHVLAKCLQIFLILY